MNTSFELRKMAFHWYMKSAERGNICEQNNLGSCHQHRIGTIKMKIISRETIWDNLILRMLST
ncbi:hypothetical protein Glove_290g53 [Diversispora epigaea]|uniref:Uncharacterized protein n=1 Tax=Diversispora epigaea TaxID=1348612 RepID=A0A397I1R1_9GLOM|nr:hypothetical protein Glove_290g53 [Diversispora epigaea]